ncbi:MAG: YibE/F family protein [Acidimicrobiales bacterium]|nr:YibE/F family protein [Acidimicrobiales bacterium]
MAHSHHAHDHGDDRTLTTERTRQLLTAVVLLVALAAVVGMLVLRPDGDRPELSEELGLSAEIVDATVSDQIEIPCAGTDVDAGIRCIDVTFEVTSGPTAGENGSFQTSVNEATIDFDTGDDITLGYQEDAEPAFRYFFNDFQRRTPLLLLVVLFAIAVLALGRFQGLRALIALGVTGVLVIGFMFPSTLDGNDPTAVALVTAAVIAIVALYLTHGVTEKITVALLGTFGALALTALLAAVFSNLARFTGFASEDAFYLTVASAQVDVKGLVLAGIIIGSLGVLDDVTVTQVSAVWQLHEANPGYSARRLYSSAVVIGRDHIASTVNTLVLAYAGASLPLLLVFTQGGRSLGAVAEGEVVGVEIVRTLVGSIGLVAAVPLTTGLAAFVVTRGSMIRPAAEARPGRHGPLRAAPAQAGDAEPPESGPAGSASWDQFAPKDPDVW